MSPCERGRKRTELSAEDARIRVGTALALLEVAAQVFEDLPEPEVAFPRGDRELYRSLQAAETARAWVVGHQAGDGVGRPGRGSALGDGRRIFEWNEAETGRQYESAMRDWSERQ